MPVAEIGRKAGISQATYFACKQEDDGLLPTEMRRLKQPEDENAKPKKPVADPSLDQEMLQDVIRRNIRGWCASASWSTRFAVAGVCRSAGPAGSFRSAPRPAPTRCVAPDRPVSRSGSRSCARRGSAKATGGFTLSCAAKAAHEAWAMDLVHDQPATGQKRRVPTIVATFSRCVPALDSRFSYRGEDVTRTLERVCAEVGAPETLRVDQGSGFIARDLDPWAYRNGVTLGFSRPGKPTGNAFIAAFDGRLRSACLNRPWFMSLADAREKLEAWRGQDNEDQPRGAIGYEPPPTLMDRGSDTGPPPR